MKTTTTTTTRIIMVIMIMLLILLLLPGCQATTEADAATATATAAEAATEAAEAATQAAEAATEAAEAATQAAEAAAATEAAEADAAATEAATAADQLELIELTVNEENYGEMSQYWDEVSIKSLENRVIVTLFLENQLVVSAKFRGNTSLPLSKASAEEIKDYLPLEAGDKINSASILDSQNYPEWTPAFWWEDGQ